MKKVFCLLLTLCMVLALTACGGGSTPANSGSDGQQSSGSDAQQPATGELISVGVINNDPNESGYRTANDAAMRAMFTEENGYKATFFNNNDAAQQIATAQQMIQDEVDFLLLSPASTTGWDTVLQDAQTAGTQVILFDRMLEADESMYVAAVVSDMPAEGVTAVEWLAAQGLDEYNIVHIQGLMGTDAQVGRTGALDEKVAAEGNWNYVTQQTASWAKVFVRFFTGAAAGTQRPADPAKSSCRWPHSVPPCKTETGKGPSRQAGAFIQYGFIPHFARRKAPLPPLWPLQCPCRRNPDLHLRHSHSSR